MTFDEVNRIEWSYGNGNGTVTKKPTEMNNLFVTHTHTHNIHEYIHMTTHKRLTITNAVTLKYIPIEVLCNQKMFACFGNLINLSIKCVICLRIVHIHKSPAAIAT